MQKYNPNIHHRRSIRLKGYDYAQAGLYFVTICVQNRENLFGNITKGEPISLSEMILNNPGKMIEKWYYELENKFPNIKCDEMIVMPNHFHCILEIVETVRTTSATTATMAATMAATTVGADLRVCPDANEQFIENELFVKNGNEKTYGQTQGQGVV